MGKVTYAKPKNKHVFTVAFRHPVMKDSTGKAGLRVHRSLCTGDEELAKSLTDLLSILVNDSYWWEKGKWSEAAQKFPIVVVNAFYDCMFNRKRTTAFNNVAREVKELAIQTDCPVYEGDEEVDMYVRLSDVIGILHKHAPYRQFLRY